MSNGNGQQQRIEIKISRLGPGWVYFEMGETVVDAADLPHWLNRALCDWLREHPDARPRSTLGVVASGATVGIHLWFDE